MLRLCGFGALILTCVGSAWAAPTSPASPHKVRVPKMFVHGILCLKEARGSHCIDRATTERRLEGPLKASTLKVQVSSGLGNGVDGPIRAYFDGPEGLEIPFTGATSPQGETTLKLGNRRLPRGHYLLHVYFDGSEFTHVCEDDPNDTCDDVYLPAADSFSFDVLGKANLNVVATPTSFESGYTWGRFNRFTFAAIFGRQLNGRFDCVSACSNVDVFLTDEDGKPISKTEVRLGASKIAAVTSDKGYVCGHLSHTGNDWGTCGAFVSARTNSQGKATFMYYAPGVIKPGQAKLTATADHEGHHYVSHETLTVKPNLVLDGQHQLSDPDVDFLVGTLDLGLASSPGDAVKGIKTACTWMSRFLDPTILGFHLLGAIDQPALGTMCSSFGSVLTDVANLGQIVKFLELYWARQTLGLKTTGLGELAIKSIIPKLELTVACGVCDTVAAGLAEYYLAVNAHPRVGDPARLRMWEISNRPESSAGVGILEPSLYVQFEIGSVTKTALVRGTQYAPSFWLDPNIPN